MIQFSSVQFDLTQIPYIVIRSETEKAKNTRYNMETQKLHRDNNNNNNNPERSKKKERKIEKEEEEENGIKSKGGTTTRIGKDRVIFLFFFF